MWSRGTPVVLSKILTLLVWNRVWTPQRPYAVTIGTHWKMVVILEQFRYEVTHISGKENSADAPSSVPVGPAQDHDARECTEYACSKPHQQHTHPNKLIKHPQKTPPYSWCVMLLPQETGVAYRAQCTKLWQKNCRFLASFSSEVTVLSCQRASGSILLHSHMNVTRVWHAQRPA